MLICTICGAKWRGRPSVCPLDGGALKALPDPLLGRTIAGRYVLTERVGEGGMGTVYRARHEVVGRDVAIKFLAPDLAGNKTNRERFLREARAANRIDHEHIIDITDYGETTDGLAYLVMEYLVGEPLSAAIERGPLRAQRAVEICAQIASALARAHELDVIHRDIKPDNAFLVFGSQLRSGERDFVKLLDFGLAKMKGEMRLTMSGAVFGTPEYMAPEQARGAPVTERADLYSLGCVLFEMLTGEPPFMGATPDLILAHIRVTAPRLSDRMQNPSPELEAVVARLLEKDPEERYRDAHHLGEDLRRVVRSLPRASNFPEATRQQVAEALSARLHRVDTRPTWSSSHDGWQEKLAHFRVLAARAYRGEVPDWLVASMDELDGWLDELRVKRANLDRSASSLMQQEEDLRSVRLQIGNAIDVLVRDESRWLRELDQTLVKIQRLRSEWDEPALRAAWEDLPPIPEADAPIDPLQIARLLRAGEAAGSWLDVHTRVEALEKRRVAGEGAREDIRFQVAQLKGRLGTLSAEGELQLQELRAKTASLDVVVQELLERTAGRSAEIISHLSQFESVREALRDVGASA